MKNGRRSRIEDGGSQLLDHRSSILDLVIFMNRRIVVVGGGIAGLAATHRLIELSKAEIS